MAAKKTPAAVYALLVVACAVLTVGMGLDGGAGITLTGVAILLFLAGIVLSLVGGRGPGPEEGPTSSDRDVP